MSFHDLIRFLMHKTQDFIRLSWSCTELASLVPWSQWCAVLPHWFTLYMIRYYNLSRYGIRQFRFLAKLFFSISLESIPFCPEHFVLLRKIKDTCIDPVAHVLIDASISSVWYWLWSPWENGEIEILRNLDPKSSCSFLTSYSEDIGSTNALRFSCKIFWGADESMIYDWREHDLCSRLGYFEGQEFSLMPYVSFNDIDLQVKRSGSQMW